MKFKRQAGFLLSKIHHISRVIFNRKLKDYKIEINSAQGRIMFVLWEKDGISINEIAEKTSLQKSTLTGMLDRLEKAGFIKRTTAKDDRRKILIIRTEKDKSFQQQYCKVAEEMNNLFYNGFSEREIQEFEKYLNRIYNNVSEK